MRGQGHHLGAGFSASVHGILAAVLVVIGLLGMHGLSAAHAGTAPAPAGMHKPTAGMHAAAAEALGAASSSAQERSCPTESPCPVADSGRSCILAPPNAHGGELDLPGQAPLPAAAAVHAVPCYRGPPPTAPSLHQLSISRT
jgi:hypothetical protein